MVTSGQITLCLFVHNTYIDVCLLLALCILEFVSLLISYLKFWELCFTLASNKQRSNLRLAISADKAKIHNAVEKYCSVQ